VCPPPSLSRLASPSSLSRAFPPQFIVVALRSGDSMLWEVQIRDREARAPTEWILRWRCEVNPIGGGGADAHKGFLLEGES